MMSSLLFLLFSCSSQVEELPTKPVHNVKVSYEDKPLNRAPEWIGGTMSNPVYYTEKGERIYTPISGVEMVPVTTRSINSRGKVIYPHHGYQLVGDMKIDHYLQLVKAVKQLKVEHKGVKPLILKADSNFISRGAEILMPDKSLVAKFEYKLLKWSRVE